MSQDSFNFNFVNGKMTAQRAMNNILAGLNKAQGKGSFDLKESAFIFSSLQKLNEFVKKYSEEDEKKPVPKPIEVPQEKKVVPKPKPQPIKKAVEKKKKLPDINLEEEDVNEVIEI